MADKIYNHITNNVSTKSVSNGIGFFGLLTIVLIALKLIGEISWSWWWVFAPIWGIPAIFIALALAFIIIFGIVKLFSKLWRSIKSLISGKTTHGK